MYGPVFADTRRLFEDLKRLKISNVDLVHLSMGMSSDYEVAIEEGATMVRSAVLFSEDVHTFETVELKWSREGENQDEHGNSGQADFLCKPS